MSINALPDNVFIKIFSICRMDEVGHATKSHHSWKWHRLAHVCRTWRHIIFASSRHLHLELLCTHGTPFKKNIGHLPAFPIAVSFLDDEFYWRKGDRDNLFAALEHRDRVQVVVVNPTYSLMEELVTVMQEPFPALTYLGFQPTPFSAVTLPPLPDTFLGGSAPRLQTIYMSRVPFPAAPTLFSSAHDLVNIRLCDIPPTGYIPPEAMVASLVVLPRLESLTFEFERGMTYPDRMPLLPTTRVVLPALTRFYFKGLSCYFEDFVAQIDVPQLDCLRIIFLEQELTYFQIPQLCKFFDRSEQFQLSRLVHASILIHPDDPPLVIDFRPVQLSLGFCVHMEATGRAISQLSAILSNVTCLSVGSFGYVDDGAGWLELFHLFTSVKALRVVEVYSPRTALLALNNITQARESAAEVLPALELLCLVDVPVTFVEKFVATRQNMGRPVTILDEEEFKERMNIRDDSE